MKAKKIIYAASVMEHINNFHLDYISALREEGNEVLVMARGNGADFDIPFEKKLLSPKNRECRKLIRGIIKREKPDVVILNTSLAAFHIRLACPMRNRPRIINIVHGYLFSEHTSSLKRIILPFAERLLKRRTDVIITMNRWDLEFAKKHRLSRGVVFFSRGMGAAVREVRTPPEAIRAEYFGSKAFVITFVGELSARKNQRFLISAMPQILERIPVAVLCLVGEGGEREDLEALCGELSLGDRVLFLGSRSDACDVIRASDLYVSASVIEGMPFNLIEAMGCGVPILASRVKGHEDLIDDGVDGFLYEYDNMQEFVNKACQIKDGLVPDAEKMRKKYFAYSKENVFPETLEIIKEAME